MTRMVSIVALTRVPENHYDFFCTIMAKLIPLGILRQKLAIALVVLPKTPVESPTGSVGIKPVINISANNTGEGLPSLPPA